MRVLGQCPICQEVFTQLEELSVLKTCGHTHHLLCIMRWIESGGKSCPTCRKSVGEEDILRQIYVNEVMDTTINGGDDAAATSEQCDKLRDQIRKLRTELSRTAETRDMLQTQYDAEYKAHKTTTTMLKSAKTELRVKDQDMSTLKQRLTSATDKLNKNKYVQDQLLDARRKLLDLETKDCLLTGSTEEARAQLAKRREQLFSSDSVIDLTQRAEMVKHDELLVMMTKKFEESRKQNDRQTIEMRHLQSDVEKLNNEKSILEGEKRQLRKLGQDLKERLIKQQDRAETLKKTVSKCVCSSAVTESCTSTATTATAANTHILTQEQQAMSNPATDTRITYDKQDCTKTNTKSMKGEVLVDSEDDDYVFSTDVIGLGRAQQSSVPQSQSTLRLLSKVNEHASRYQPSQSLLTRKRSSSSLEDNNNKSKVTSAQVMQRFLKAPAKAKAVVAPTNQDDDDDIVWLS